MAGRKSKPRTGRPAHSTVVGIGWYDPVGWAKLRQVAADAERLHGAYDEWVRDAERAERELAGRGLIARRVEVDIDALVTWCAARQKPVDGPARAAYVQEQVRGHGEPPNDPPQQTGGA